MDTPIKKLDRALAFAISGRSPSQLEYGLLSVDEDIINTSFDYLKSQPIHRISING